jgi:hypothetical protein
VKKISKMQNFPKKSAKGTKDWVEIGKKQVLNKGSCKFLLYKALKDEIRVETSINVSKCVSKM